MQDSSWCPSLPCQGTAYQLGVSFGFASYETSVAPVPKASQPLVSAALDCALLHARDLQSQIVDLDLDALQRLRDAVGGPPVFDLEGVVRSIGLYVEPGPLKALHSPLLELQARYRRVIEAASPAFADAYLLGIHLALAEGQLSRPEGAGPMAAGPEAQNHAQRSLVEAASLAGEIGLPDAVSALLVDFNKGVPNLQLRSSLAQVRDRYAKALRFVKTQSGWRWCARCQVLWHAGGNSHGACARRGVEVKAAHGPAPASQKNHAHTAEGSAEYLLVTGLPKILGQYDWRWCRKCEELWFAGGESKGRCPAGGAHTQTGSAEYALLFSSQDTKKLGQSNWRWCRKCQALFFGGRPQSAHCPAGGFHDGQGSSNYMIPLTGGSQEAQALPNADENKIARDGMEKLGQVMDEMARDEEQAMENSMNHMRDVRQVLDEMLTAKADQVNKAGAV